MATMSTLEDLFVKELRDMYDAERQITKALPKMIKASESPDLTEALQQHLDVTKGQIARLDRVFQQLEMRPRGLHCAGMAGIIEEGSEMLQEGGEDMVMDAALIGAAQKVEHYEIASYGTLCAFARQLGHDGAVPLLDQNLEEEKEADQRLTQLAEAHINRQAHAGDGTSMDEEDGTSSTRRGRAASTGRTQSSRGTSSTSSSRSASSARGTSTRQASGSRGMTGGRGAQRSMASASNRRSTASDRSARRK